MLIFDANEFSNHSEWENICRNNNIKYKIENLVEGDITNNKGTFIIEVKRNDLWTSMTSKHIYKQFVGMYKHYEDNRFLFVPTAKWADLVYERGHENWVYSIFGEAMNWDIKIVEFIDEVDLLRKAAALDKKLGSERKVRHEMPKLPGLGTPQKMLMMVDGIGKKLSKQILNEMGSMIDVIEDVINTDGEKMSKIKGIAKGGKIITRFKDELLRQN